jgi:hypothetical protein
VGDEGAVAAKRRRLQQRRLPAVAAVVVGAGRMHVTVIVFRPAAWLTATHALRPLSIQRSYNAKKISSRNGWWWPGAGWFSHAGSHTTSNHTRPCG